MLSSLNELFLQFNTYSKSNPIIAGAMALWGLGVLTFVCRHIPVQLYNFLYNQFTTRLYFNDTYEGYNAENYRSFMVWFTKRSYSKYMRSMKLVSKPWMDKEHEHYVANATTVITGVGNGKHFFFYKYHLFIINHSTLDKAGSNVVISQINLTMFGRNKAVLASLVDEFSYKYDDSKLCIYRYDKEWDRLSDFPKRALETVIIDAELKNEVVRIITEFKADREWYVTRGLPYKKTFIFHGVTGTGKTSLIKAIANHFDMGICFISISAMTDRNFQAAITTAPSKNIVVIEDFDSASATRSRELKQASDGMGEMLSMLSLSSILNTLDGVVTLDDKLIFLSTNVLDTLDSALTRSGRVDHIFEIKALRHKEVCEYIDLMFPGIMIQSHITFKDIVGCDLQALYFESKANHKAFIDSIPKVDSKIF